MTSHIASFSLVARRTDIDSNGDPTGYTAEILPVYPWPNERLPNQPATHSSPPPRINPTVLFGTFLKRPLKATIPHSREKGIYATDGPTRLVRSPLPSSVVERKKPPSWWRPALGYRNWLCVPSFSWRYRLLSPPCYCLVGRPHILFVSVWEGKEDWGPAILVAPLVDEARSIVHATTG